MNLTEEKKKITISLLKVLFTTILFLLISLPLFLITKSFPNKTLYYLFLFAFFFIAIPQTITLLVNIKMYKDPRYYYTFLYEFMSYDRTYRNMLQFTKDFIYLCVSIIASIFIIFIFTHGNLSKYFNYIIIFSIIVASIRYILRFIELKKIISYQINEYNQAFEYYKNYYENMYKQQQTTYQTNTHTNNENNYQKDNNYEEKIEKEVKKEPYYYEILGFKNEPESFDDIKLAYRRLVKINHPDRGGDVEMMQKINLAYDEAKKNFDIK